MKFKIHRLSKNSTCFLLLIFFLINSLFSQNLNPIVVGDLEVATYNFGFMNWNDAKNTISRLGNEWRLPTTSELKFKIYPNRFNGLNINSSVYWTSSESNLGGTSSAEYVNMSNGYMSADLKSNNHFVIAVRNYSPPASSYNSTSAYNTKTNTTTKRTITWKGQNVHFDEVFWSKDEHYEGYGFISESEMRYYKQGQGTTYLGNGAYEKGNYVRDKLQGQGEEYWPSSGQKYVGEYKDDKWDGIGTLITAGLHETKYGYFKAGEYVSPIQETNTQIAPSNYTKSNSNAKLSEIPHDGHTIKEWTQNLFDKMYNSIFLEVTTTAMFGGKPDIKHFTKLEEEQTVEIKNKVEGWLGQAMTKSQLNEFNSIKKKSEEDAAFAMKLMGQSLSNLPKDNSSFYSDKNESFDSWQCQKCGQISRSTRPPDNYMNSCPYSSTNHSWCKANTNHGWQCYRCGLQDIILEHNNRKPKWIYEWNTGKCLKGEHHPNSGWTKF